MWAVLNHTQLVPGVPEASQTPSKKRQCRKGGELRSDDIACLSVETSQPEVPTVRIIHVSHSMRTTPIVLIMAKGMMLRVASDP